MTCTDVEEREIAESYLLGRLTEADREAFERHYFECSRCYSELETLRVVREALVPPPRRSPGVSRWQWLAVAAALMLAVSAVIAWQALRFREPAQTAGRVVGSVPGGPPPSPNSEEIAHLAAVAPPPYAPSRFRDGGERAAFALGMRRYVAHDFAGAIRPLERAVRESPSADDARFYLGASYLLAGRSRNAISTFEPLAARARSPYAEEAQFLIAKACLQSGDLRAALAALDKTIAIHGDREQDARAIRSRVPYPLP
jgi:tetratricopeptide (TPR) repeat protein